MDVSAQVAPTPARCEDIVSDQPLPTWPPEGCWWEWVPGRGWEARTPVPEPQTETGQESAA